VANLPDIESTQNVDLPPFLIENGKKRRYDTEMEELDAFSNALAIQNTTLLYHQMTDYIADYGIDGYRADTVKHTEASVWADFKAQSEYAFATWKKNNQVLDNNFYSIAEVYNYNISAGKSFDFEIRK
jgi:alpha-amylase